MDVRFLVSLGVSLLCLLSYCTVCDGVTLAASAHLIPSTQTRSDNATLFHSCATLSGATLSLPVCIDILLNDSCVFTVRITIASIVIERHFKGALPPEICIEQGFCQVCIRFNDLTSSSGCIVLALVCQGLELASKPLDCFSIPLGSCLACPQDCSGHGDCNNGACICDDGYSGEDCSEGHPGAFWKQCIGLQTVSRLRMCLELAISVCEVNIAISSQNNDGSNSHTLYETSIHIEELEINPEAHVCYPLLGCELCVKINNFTLNETSHLASGCPVMLANCFGYEYPPAPFGCFKESGILGTCADCPDNCNAPNGECRNGVCHCKGDWKGASCGYKNCVANCSGHGTCELGQCVCDAGWAGDSCALVCDGNGTNLISLDNGVMRGLTLKAGESFAGFISSKLNLAGLSFVVNAKNNGTIDAYARRNCIPTTEYHDAKKLGIGMNTAPNPYYGAGVVFHVVQDCYLAWRGDRWYVKFECHPCSTCEQQCVFDLGTYVHYVEKLKPDTVYSNVSILPSQRNHYSIHVSELTDDYLSIHVAQTPTDNSTMLSLIALQEDRCPGDPPYTASVSKPVSSLQQGDRVVHKFFLLKERGLNKGNYYLRIDGCADSSTHRCQKIQYTVSYHIGKQFCVEECLNGGTCSGINGCHCATGWNGALCETPICAMCINGVCSGPDTCTCNAGWSGNTCDIKNKKVETSSAWDKTSIALGVVGALGVAATVTAGIVAFYYWRKRNRQDGYGLLQFQELELDGEINAS